MRNAKAMSRSQDQQLYMGKTVGQWVFIGMALAALAAIFLV